MQSTRLAVALLWTLLTAYSLLAQEAAVDYFQSAAFNAPILEGWEDQSSETIAQFYHADARAAIRTNVIRSADAVSGAEQDLQAWLGSPVEAPIYQDKVNLADGTWVALVYQIDADTTASVMARQDGTDTVIISFVEDHPAARIIMAVIARDDETQDDARAEIAAALEAFSLGSGDDLSEPQAVAAPGGEWLLQSSETVTAMGRVFGNDSYLAIAEGDVDSLLELANAYHTGVLGFFVTPDNSNFLWLGLAAVFGILGILLFSFVWRERHLQQELALIQELAREDE